VEPGVGSEREGVNQVVRADVPALGELGGDGPVGEELGEAVEEERLGDVLREVVWQVRQRGQAARLLERADH